MDTNHQLINYVRSFITRSERARDQYVEVWQDCLLNYLLAQPETSFDTNKPFTSTREKTNQEPYLRDSETFQVIETLYTKLMLVLFPASGDFIACEKRGREDAIRARTVQRLLKYALGKPESYEVFSAAIKSALIFGTSIIEVSWLRQIGRKVERGVELIQGVEIPNELVIENGLLFNDPVVNNIDVMDFYPDPSADRISKMKGAAKRFEITEGELKDLAEQGVYDSTAVEMVLSSKHTNVKTGKRDKSWQIQRNMDDDIHPSLNPYEGFEYWGQVPEDAIPQDGVRWRVVTMIGDQIVRNEPWPFDTYRVPFFDITYNRLENRFYGIGFAEIIRYDQDFLDVLKDNMAKAVVRMVNPPIIVSKDDELDLRKLQRTPGGLWRPDRIIASENPASIRPLNYGADIFGGGRFFAVMKDEARSATGSLGAVRGQGLGVDRASATEAARTFQFAMDRPEQLARFVEEVCLPPLGKFILGLYKQQLVDANEIASRIGEEPEVVELSDIHLDYDIRFVGGRNYATNAQRLQFLDRIIQLMMIPGFATFFDQTEFGKQVLDMAGYDVLSQTAGSPEVVTQNLLLAQLLSGQGIIANQPAGLPQGTPAQNQGGVLPPGEQING